MESPKQVNKQDQAAPKEDHRKKIKLTKEEEVKQVKIKSIEKDAVSKTFNMLKSLGKLFCNNRKRSI
jgi:hypothetical protein